MIYKLMADNHNIFYDNITEFRYRLGVEFDFLSDDFVDPNMLILSKEWERRFKSDNSKGKVNIINFRYKGWMKTIMTEGDSYLLNDEGTTIEVIRGVDGLHGSLCKTYTSRDDIIDK